MSFRNKHDIPFVVVAQSRSFDSYRRRVVIQIVRKSELSQSTDPRLNPTLKVKENAVVLHPLEIASVANDHLGERVGSRVDKADAIVATLDEPFTCAFG